MAVADAGYSPDARFSSSLADHAAGRCLGCGGDGVSVNEKAGEEATPEMEELQKKAELNRNTGAKRAPRR